MGREIKYRGKPIKGEVSYSQPEWVFGNYISADRNEETHHYITGKRLFYTNAPVVPYADMVKVMPETVGQYTGRKDKKGKEIYEHDLVKVYHRGQWVTLEIVWNQLGMWSVKWKDGYLNNYHLNSEGMEIIGTIHDKK